MQELVTRFVWPTPEIVNLDFKDVYTLVVSTPGFTKMVRMANL